MIIDIRANDTAYPSRAFMNMTAQAGEKIKRDVVRSTPVPEKEGKGQKKKKIPTLQTANIPSFRGTAPNPRKNMPSAPTSVSIKENP
jgi:hypothetical protein